MPVKRANPATAAITMRDSMNPPCLFAGAIAPFNVCADAVVRALTKTGGN
jgi:hypothetical protein